MTQGRPDAAGNDPSRDDAAVPGPAPAAAGSAGPATAGIARVVLPPQDPPPPPPPPRSWTTTLIVAGVLAVALGLLFLRKWLGAGLTLAAVLALAGWFRATLPPERTPLMVARSRPLDVALFALLAVALAVTVLIVPR